MAGTSYKGSEIRSVDQFLADKAGLSSSREKEIGQHIGYRYDVTMYPKQGMSNIKKIVAGKQLWNYDNLEPSEKKLVL